MEHLATLRSRDKNPKPKFESIVIDMVKVWKKT